jgi:ferritin-like metal-binding protein YciE
MTLEGSWMSQSDQKVVQYLSEARASEIGLVSDLQSQIAMTPRGSYRDGLEKHLDETHTHARRIQERLGELGEVRNPFQAFFGFSEAVVGQMLALSKAPFDVLRGSSGEEKVLKNAKDACATEELEIATYTALERLAIKVGDKQTAKLAASIRGDEERMLKRLMLEIPKLTDAVVRAEIEGHPSDGMTETAAVEATRKVSRQPKTTARKTSARKTTARKTSARAERTTRQSRRASGDAPVARQRKASGSSEEPLPIERYRSLSTEQILSRLSELSESDLGNVASYERKNKNRPAVLGRIRVLRGEEPWPGYDKQTIAEVEAGLNEGDYGSAQDILVYERAHKNRPEVVQSALVPARFLLSTSNR